MRYGLDFGTSNSAISFFDGSGISMLPVEPDTRTPSIMPSLWYFEELEKQWYFGVGAFHEYRQNGDGRFIQSMKKLLADGSFIGTHIGYRFYPFEQLIELYFKEIKTRADAIVGANIRSVTIGKPACFSHGLDDALAEKRLYTAAQRAGFEDIDFLFEPLAATYTLKQQIDRPTVVFTLDMGGGTTDVSLVRLYPDNDRRDHILTTLGISVGGMDFTSAIMKRRLLSYFGWGSTYTTIFGKQMPFPKYALRLILDWYNSLKMVHNHQFMAFLKEVERSSSDPSKIKALKALVFEKLGLDIFGAIEHAKIKLSDYAQAAVDYQYDDISILESIGRKEFEDYIAPYAVQVDTLFDNALSQAGIANNDIEAVLLVGGSSKIPFFKKMIAGRFPASPVFEADTFTSVAYGLSVADYNHCGG